MAKLLRWVIHTLEVFMWEKDHDLSPDDPYPGVPYPSGPYLDLLPEYWPEDWDDGEEDSSTSEDASSVPEAEVRWRVQIEYADETTQEIVSYQNYLSDKPDELFFALTEYFPTDDADFDEDMEE